MNKHNDQEGQIDMIQLDIRKWLLRLLSYWWLFVISIGIALAAGHFYLKYSTYQYVSRATLLIKETDNSGLISEESILLDKGFTGTGKSLVNEIEILKSAPLMEKVVEELQLHISFFRQGRLKATEYYRPQPFNIEQYILLNNRTRTSFFIETLDKESFLIKGKIENEGERYFYDTAFQCDYGYFTISSIDSNFVAPGVYQAVINSTENIANYYASQLRVERVGDPSQSSILQLQLRDPIPKKAEDILNALINNYNKEDIDDENEVLRNTLEFIDNRAEILSAELNAIESNLERFKSRNAVISESASTSMSFTLEEIRSSLQQINQFEVRKSILISLEDFLKEDHELFEPIPINLSTETPILTNLISEYNNMVVEWNRLIKTAGAENPVRKNLEQRILSNRALIDETLKGLLEDMDIPIQQLKDNITSLEQRMSNIPSLDKSLVEQTRMQEIKQELYLYLLKKREETALSEAVATASTRTIQPPRSSRAPVYPRKQLIYLACLLLGFFIPLAIVTIIGWLDNKISSIDTIKQLTSLPILGKIFYKKKNNYLVVGSDNRSAIKELFRQLWTNLSYLNVEEKQKVLAITSPISGEGKTFIAINLAYTIALSHNKTLLLELDLRKPKIGSYLNLDNPSPGLTSYLIGESSIDDIIENVENADNLHIIRSGPIPPNPYELISSERMELLMKELIKRYDHVIIDTPPVSLVSDALLLRKFLTNILVIVRYRYTRKFMLRDIEEMKQNGELPNSGIILNGIKPNGSYYNYRLYSSKYGGDYYK